MTTATLPPPPRQTANPAPPRAAHSIRRTSSIDISWLGDPAGPRRLVGRARDFLTGADPALGRVHAAAEVEAQLAFDKTIEAISAEPAPAGFAALVGVRAGNHLRVFVRETLPELAASGDPLYLLLDDMSGTALVSPWALSQWYPDVLSRMHDTMPPEQMARYNSPTGVCWGLKPGSSGMTGGMDARRASFADGGELRNSDDALGWHAFPESEGPSFRRARRIEVSRVGGTIRIDAAFQDSGPRPQGGRAAIHEYLLAVEADGDSLEVLSLVPEGRILPFPECPGAVANAQRMVGKRLPEIRDAVLAELRGPEGCTHLNDALRALADVPALLAALDAA